MRTTTSIVVLLILAVSMCQAQEFRAFWCDAWHVGYENPAATQSMVDYVGASNANVVIAEVRKRGDAYYASTLEPAGINMTPQAGYDCLGDIVTKTHAAGQEAHAWVVTYRVWTFTTPPATTTPDHVFNTHPEWFNLTNTGAKFDAGNNSFLDPGHPEVENYNAAVFNEIIRNYNVDAIHLDYIRYPGTTWGYNATAVARYNAEYGTTGNPATTDTRWSNWRRDQITNMVKRVYLEAKAIRPTIKVGASVWKTSPTGDSGYFQNYDLWMSRHWLDYCCPMNYTTTNTTFDSNARDSLGRMYGRHIYMGQGAYMNTASTSMWQLADAQSLGFPGVSIYSYAVTNSGTVDRAGFQSALLSGPFATPQSIPVMGWISSPTLGMLKGFVKDTGGNAVYPATVTIGGDSTKNSGAGFYGFVDLTPGTYSVTATAPGQSPGSGVVTITAGLVANLDITLGATDTEAPTQPTNLSATAVSGTQVNLTWTASTDNVGVTGYKVFRNSAQIGTSVTTSYSDTTCSPGTTYTYEVSAYDAAGNESLKSSPAVVTTPADTTPPVLSNIVGTGLTRGFKITWTTNEPATSQVEYGLTTAYGSMTLLDSNLVTNHSVTQTGLVRRTTYHYRVRSRDAAGNEAVSGDGTVITK